ncbi:hypothetical protein L228DRAFT_265727 [Xylona heveae TC161]|uniref:Uncharacterized protein n=1 Tax=Xylona heveae (strain CBS 132557 / TC161) TaxID=1328760 RepID=A0A165IQV1_XYLHT|nr:hypothetical protein L228DRAFT_265727 [Xylona heveae TC161]KZF25251.1 hypothetical protein L228DRAFT_265727 [Xylona heveae TC161]
MSYHSTSPVLLLRPQQPSSFHFSSSMTPSAHSSFTSPSSFNSSSPFQSCARKSPKTLATLPNKPSRKRSRDEALSPTDAAEDASYFSHFPAPLPRKDLPLYGGAMTPLNPSSGFSSSAVSATWVEPNAEGNAATPAAAQADSVSSTRRKAQRLDITASRPEDVSDGAVGASNAPSSNGGISDPAVDDFTRLLGVGWTRLSNDDGVQAAARGWARYIENHFPVSNASIMLQSRGLGAYLVGSQQGFYLFHEELADGQLVATAWDQTLANLQARPIVFEGSEVLKATRTPAIEAAMDNSAAATTSSTPIAGNAQPAAASSMDLD